MPSYLCVYMDYGWPTFKNGSEKINVTTTSDDHVDVDFGRAQHCTCKVGPINHYY